MPHLYIFFKQPFKREVTTKYWLKLILPLLITLFMLAHSLIFKQKIFFYIKNKYLQILQLVKQNITIQNLLSVLLGILINRITYTNKFDYTQITMNKILAEYIIFYYYPDIIKFIDNFIFLMVCKKRL